LTLHDLINALRCIIAMSTSCYHLPTSLMIASSCVF